MGYCYSTNQVKETKPKYHKKSIPNALKNGMG